MGNSLQADWEKIRDSDRFKKINKNAAIVSGVTGVLKGDWGGAVLGSINQLNKRFPASLRLYDFEISLNSDVDLSLQERCMLVATTMFIRERCYRKELSVEEDLDYY